ncbi:MAG: hypothetical protein WCP53_14155, partial [Verrucomicrobiota bacterium]
MAPQGSAPASHDVVVTRGPGRHPRSRLPRFSLAARIRNRYDAAMHTSAYRLAIAVSLAAGLLLSADAASLT